MEMFCWDQRDRLQRTTACTFINCRKVQEKRQFGAHTYKTNLNLVGGKKEKANIPTGRCLPQLAVYQLEVDKGIASTLIENGAQVSSGL